MTPKEIHALGYILDYIERWNKCDEDELLAEAAELLEKFVTPSAQGIVL